MHVISLDKNDLSLQSCCIIIALESLTTRSVSLDANRTDDLTPHKSLIISCELRQFANLYSADARSIAILASLISLLIQQTQTLSRELEQESFAEYHITENADQYNHQKTKNKDKDKNKDKNKNKGREKEQ